MVVMIYSDRDIDGNCQNQDSQDYRIFGIGMTAPRIKYGVAPCQATDRLLRITLTLRVIYS